MTIRVSCPNPGCGAVASVEEQSLGKRGRCKKCGHVFALARPDGKSMPGVSGDASAWKKGSAEPAGPTNLPEQFGRYRIMKQLGQGGMGAVYLAHDTKLEREVALKVPYFNPADGPEAVQRFEREARAAATLDHPNLCPIHDVGEFDGIHYLTMPYIQGKPLSEAIGYEQKFSEGQAAAIVLKLAQALQEAHDKGIIHRDLKPSNIMINRHRELIVMDFGLARVANDDKKTITRTGKVLGTALYMAPEQASGDLAAIGPQADIYSLGVILYELLTGRLPFEGPWGLVIGLKNVKDPAPPSKYRPDLNPTLDAICHKAIAKEPKDRYATMSELAAELGLFLKSVSTPVLTPSGTANPEEPLESLAGQVFVGIITQEITSIREERSVAQPMTERLKRSPSRRRGWSGIISAVGAAILLVGVIIFVVKKEQGSDNNKEPKTEVASKTVQPQEPNPKQDSASEEPSPQPEPEKTDEEESKPVAPVFSAGEKPIFESSQPSPPATEPGKTAPTEADSKKVAKNGGTSKYKNGGSRNRGNSERNAQPTFDLSKFHVNNGEWMIVGDELHQLSTQPNCNHLVFGDHRWVDYDFSVDLMRVSGYNGASILSRYQNKDNGYYLHLGAVKNTLTDLGAWVSRQHEVVDRRQGAGIDYHKWYHARIRVRGSLVQTTIDDEGTEILQLQFENNSIKAGCVGLGAYGSVFRFKNILVTAPNGLVLWKGLPAIGPGIATAGAGVDLEVQ